MPGILTVIVFSIALTLHEFVYALAFVTSSDQKTVSIGVTTDRLASTTRSSISDCGD